MTLRRSLPLLPLLLVLSLPAPASASVSQTIEVGFLVPSGVKPKQACAGKITVAAPIAKKHGKTVYSKKRAPLKVVDGDCNATAIMTFPDSLIGKTLKFKVTFGGNSRINKFAKTTKIKVEKPFPPVPPLPVPPAPPAPSPPQAHLQGYWEARIGDSDAFVLAFTIAGDDTVHVLNQYGNIEFDCAAAGTSAMKDFQPYSAPFTVVNDSASATADYSQSGEVVHSSFSFSFGHSTGTGSITQSGTILAPPSGGGADQLTSGCTTGTVPLVLRWVPPI